MGTSLLEAVAAPRRRQILRVVWERELPAGEIHAAVSEISFGAVSQHLKVLREAGAVSMRKDGRRRIYRAEKGALGPLVQVLEREWDERLARLKALAEAEERAR